MAVSTLIGVHLQALLSAWRIIPLKPNILIWSAAGEQILGPQALSKVPTEFQTQYPHYANPPTLSLLLTNIITKLTKKTPYTGQSSKYTTSSQDAQSLVKELLSLFDRHYNWYRRTQSGNLTAYSHPGGVNSEAYR